ncbi:3-hydroxybutyryl-CoA dehydratase [Lasiosphaeria ovina]|uniref:3-hydroxybutyryl-CoA dehydratase n=1 Tax=Lasiosphaeria ovina TaxID=92902 RepID=A0AAE0KB93_9PEZI|nr:3-hydroxybutyryl-CoA dehydratase [Lasiosphaeria ovina]
MADGEEDYYADDWPKMPDDTDFSGRDHLLALVASGNSPFARYFDITLLIREIEEKLGVRISDMPFVSRGSNNYGFHLKLSDGSYLVARFSRSDVSEAKFETEAYQLLRLVPNVLASLLLYYRLPVQLASTSVEVPKDILGRRLFVFERAEGENNVWKTLSPDHKATWMRAALFNYNPPPDFCSTWLLERLYEQKPVSLPVAVAPTRDFCVSLFTSKIEATIRNIGDIIGWVDDGNTVGPVAFAAKQSLLRFIPHMLPYGDEAVLYRLVLDHGDFGIHNMSIATDADGRPRVTSLYDWETGCVVPALLSDPLMAVAVDLISDGDARPGTTRVRNNATAEERAEYMAWSTHYFNRLFDHAPSYEVAIRAGKNARHLWYSLRDWRGEDPERYFGELGAWAERMMTEPGVQA